MAVVCILGMATWRFGWRFGVQRNHRWRRNVGQGNDGGLGQNGGKYPGGGGGGAGESGYDASDDAHGADGGDGLQNDFSGVLTYYAGGGASGTRTGGTSPRERAAWAVAEMLP